MISTYGIQGSSEISNRYNALVKDIAQGALGVTWQNGLFVATLVSALSPVSWYVVRSFGDYAREGADLMPVFPESFNHRMAEPSAIATNFLLSQYLFTLMAYDLIYAYKLRSLFKKHEITQSAWLHARKGAWQIFLVAYSFFASLTLAALAKGKKLNFYFMLGTYTVQHWYGVKVLDVIWNAFSKIFNACSSVRRQYFGGAERQSLLAPSFNVKISKDPAPLTQWRRDWKRHFIFAVLALGALFCQGLSLIGFFRQAGLAVTSFLGVEESSDGFLPLKMLIFVPFAGLNVQFTFELLEDWMRAVESAFFEGLGLCQTALLSSIELLIFLGHVGSLLPAYESTSVSLGLNDEADASPWTIWPTLIGGTMFAILPFNKVIHAAFNKLTDPLRDASGSQKDVDQRWSNYDLAWQFFKSQDPLLKLSAPQLSLTSSSIASLEG